MLRYIKIKKKQHLSELSSEILKICDHVLHYLMLYLIIQTYLKNCSGIGLLNTTRDSLKVKSNLLYKTTSCSFPTSNNTMFLEFDSPNHSLLISPIILIEPSLLISLLAFLKKIDIILKLGFFVDHGTACIPSFLVYDHFLYAIN